MIKFTTNNGIISWAIESIRVLHTSLKMEYRIGMNYIDYDPTIQFMTWSRKSMALLIIDVG